MGLRLGSLELPSTIVQSPMAACSDLPFRLVARRRGLKYCYTEMVSAQALVRKNEKTFRLLKTVAEDAPLGTQLLGCDPAMMGEAAAMLDEMGFASIDLNLGCPVKKVTSNGEGSALLKEPALAEEVFKSVRRAVKKAAFTVKMRKGFEDPSGAQAVELAKRAEGAGVCWITVHGRTQQQMYTGRSDYDAIGKVKAAVKIPVLGNGDVISVDDARRLQETSGCDGIMIGRAGLGNPWVYENLRRGLENGASPYVPTVAERRDALLEHLDLELLHCGERQAAVNLRRIVMWYTVGLPNAKPLRVAVCRTMDVPLIRRMIEDYFNALPSDIPAPQTPVLLAE